MVVMTDWWDQQSEMPTESCKYELYIHKDREHMWTFEMNQKALKPESLVCKFSLTSKVTYYSYKTGEKHSWISGNILFHIPKYIQLKVKKDPMVKKYNFSTLKYYLPRLLSLPGGEGCIMPLWGLSRSLSRPIGSGRGSIIREWPESLSSWRSVLFSLIRIRKSLDPLLHLKNKSTCCPLAFFLTN